MLPWIMPPIFSGLLDALSQRFSTHPELGADESPRTPVRGATPAPDDVNIQRVGAWAGTSCFASLDAAKKTVALAKKIGLTRLDIIVNDESKSRRAKPFETFTIDHIVALAKLAKDAEIDVHLMSWIMPHELYIKGAADVLAPLAERTAATSICFDTEEPWNEAEGKFDYDVAAATLEQRLASVPWGVTGIGYASGAKLGPLVRRADYGLPQAYITARSGLSPATGVAKVLAHWRHLWPEIPLQVGLAAYRQKGISGYTEEAAIRTSFGGAQSDRFIADVVYWSFGFIRSSVLMQRVLTELIASAKG